MSEREFAFGQVLASLGPVSEVEIETLQSVFNAGWDASLNADEDRMFVFGRMPMLPVISEHMNRVYGGAS